MSTDIDTPGIILFKHRDHVSQFCILSKRSVSSTVCNLAPIDYASRPAEFAQSALCEVHASNSLNPELQANKALLDDRESSTYTDKTRKMHNCSVSSQLGGHNEVTDA